MEDHRVMHIGTTSVTQHAVEAHVFQSQPKSGPASCKMLDHLFHPPGSSLAQLLNEANTIHFSNSCKTLAYCPGT